MANVKKTRKAAGNSCTEQVEAYLLERYDFQYDILLHELQYRKRGDKDFKQLTDRDEGTLFGELDRAGVKFKDVHLSKFLKSTVIPSCHRVKDYFDAFDKEKKIREQLLATDPFRKLSDLLELSISSQKDFVHLHLAKFLMRCIKSVYEPFYFNKNVFVLISKSESIGKSYFFSKLIPPELRQNYYQTNYRMTPRVDAEKGLASNFLINLEEINQYTQGGLDTAKIKSLISLSQMKVRLTHGKRDTRLVRLASFVGTCNEVNFLRKDLGTSRWIPIKVNGVRHLGKPGDARDAEVSKIVRDAWREAYFSYKEMPNFCDLSTNDLKALKKITNYFIEVPAEQELITEYIAPAEKGGGEDVEFLNATEILVYLQKIAPRVNLNKIAVGRALNEPSLGFSKCKKGWKDGYYCIKKMSGIPQPL